MEQRTFYIPTIQRSAIEQFDEAELTITAPISHDTEKRLWDNRLIRRLGISITAAAAAISSITFGGDYLAHRFGSEAGDSAFNAFNGQAQRGIAQLEHSAPNVLAQTILPKAVCDYAQRLRISRKVLKSEHVDCPNPNNHT